MVNRDNPVIFVMAYEREQSLSRLLSSLKEANYSQGTDLIVTVGLSPSVDKIRSLCGDFHWPHGAIEVTTTPRPMSITEHRRWIFETSIDRGYPGIILLEDDLVVSPGYYNFATQCLSIFSMENGVAGISLNSLWFNGYTKYPFLKLQSDFDIYQMQLPFYHGQVFSTEMIRRYLSWMDDWDGGISHDLHPLMADLAEEDDEWFPMMSSYLIETNQFFIYPYGSMSTNYGEVGKHFATKTSFLQTPLSMRMSNWLIPGEPNKLVAYDHYQEILAPSLFELLDPDNRIINVCSPDMLTIDLNGTRSFNQLRTDFVLTIRPVDKAIMTFDHSLKPLVMNVVMDIDGEGISLARRGDLKFGKSAERYLKDFRYRSSSIDTYEKNMLEYVWYKLSKGVRFF